MFDIREDEYPILPEAVQMILRSIGKPIDTLTTCHNCGAVTEIGQRCDGCGRYV